MDADEWIRRQAKAKDEVYDLINQGGAENLLRAIDIAWLEYTNYTGPVMMTDSRKTRNAYQSLSNFAKRMVIDSACALAYERSQDRGAPSEASAEPSAQPHTNRRDQST